MSLLDDVSIVVTPNGYKAGELYAVVPVPTEGAELVTDGDFPTGSTAWTKNGWTINEEASNDGVNTGNLNQDIGLQQNKRYLIEVTISNYNSGTLQVRLGTGTNVDVGSSEDTFSLTLISTTTNSLLRFYPKVGDLFNGSIDNVSVKEYTASDMDVTRATAATRVDEDGLVNYAEIIGGEEIVDGDFPSGTTDWTVSGGTVSFDNGATFDIDSKIYQLDALVTGKIYKATYEITDNVGGMTLRFYNGGSYFNVDDSVGVHTVYFTALPSNTRLYINTQTGTSLVLKNISLKEVTRDNVPRIDYTGGGCPHILAEPQRTNIVFPSDVAVTQTRTVTAVEYALSFYGTGSIVLSGTHSATLTGTGVNDRVDLIFTPTAGSLVLTVSGTVTNFQLEVGSYATSYIPTVSGTVTRNQDIFTRDGIGSLINSTEGVLFVEMAALSDDGVAKYLTMNDGSSNNDVRIYFNTTSNGISALLKSTTGATQAFLSYTVTDTTEFHKIAFVYAVNRFELWIDGENRAEDLSGIAPVGLTTLEFSRASNFLPLFAKVRQLQVYKTALSPTQLAALTS